MSIPFSKMSGNGNDFIIIDNRSNSYDTIINSNFIQKVCARGLSVGADGLILIENSSNANFKWQFFNSDGTVAEMCGNGARCATRYAYLKKIAPKNMTFETIAGIIEGYVEDNNEVKVLLTPYNSYKDDYKELNVNGNNYKPYFINTGVPHVVVFCDDVSKINIAEDGAFLRHNKIFGEKGTNVNFATVTGKNNLTVRTFERGVEAETLACGTGCTAAALVSIKLGYTNSPVKVLTAGGKILTVFSEENKTYLQGEGRLVYDGEINTEAYVY